MGVHIVVWGVLSGEMELIVHCPLLCGGSKRE